MTDQGPARTDLIYLVTKNWVELVENIFGEPSSLYGDRASSNSDFGWRYLGHQWQFGGHARTWGTSGGGYGF